MRQLESFFWGIIAALGALFAELVIYIVFSTFFPQVAQLSYDALSSLPAFIIAFAFTEELFKYIIIAKRIDTYSFERTFVVNALMVGLGFAATEFMLLSSIGNMPENKILLELATIHIGTAGIMGYLVAIKNPKRIRTFLQTAIIATTFHAGYNLLIEKRELLQNYLILSLLGFLVIYNLFNLLRVKSKLAQE